MSIKPLPLRLLSFLLGTLLLWALVACAAPDTGSVATPLPPTAPPATAVPTATPTTPATAEPTTVPTPATEPRGAQSARMVLAQILGVPATAPALLSVEARDFGNACLGVAQVGIMCAEVITPGHVVTLAVDGNRYVYHTSLDGGTVLLVEAPPVDIAQPILTWRSAAGVAPCHAATFGPDRAAAGRCDGPQIDAPIANAERRAELAELQAQFAAFSAQTAAGDVTFTGRGATIADAAQQRMIAEWAALAAQEAEAGRSGASWGLALAWHREGGIAGFCDDLALYANGRAAATQCGGSEPQAAGRARLDAAQLAQLYDYLDRYAPFEYVLDDGAVADSMTTRLVFSGRGTQVADDAAQAEIAAWAGEVFNSVGNAGGSQQPPAGLYYSVMNGATYRVAGEQIDLPVADGSVWLNPAASIAVTIDYGQPAQPLLVRYLPGDVVETLPFAGGRFVACFGWESDNALLCGVRYDAEEDSPNFGYLTRVDVIDGSVDILDAQNTLFSAPALGDGQILVSFGDGPAALWRNGTREPFDWRSYAGLPDETLRAIASPALASDGAHSAWFVYGAQQTHLVRFDMAGTAATLLYSFEPAGFGGPFRNPQFSPDGSRLAFEILTVDGTGNGLYVVNADGSAAPRWLGADAGGPLWLDATTLLFTRQADGQPASVVQYDLSGDLETPFALPVNSRALALVNPHAYPASPDGGFIVQSYYSSAQAVPAELAEQFPTGENYRVLLLVTDSATGVTQRVVDQYRAMGLGWDVPIALGWSPDSRTLYFSNAPSPDGCVVAANASDLQALDASTGAISVILPNFTALYMALSPDATLVAYEGARGAAGRSLVLTALPTGDEVARLPLPAPADDWQLGDLSWSPDGAYLLVQQVFDACAGQPRIGYAVVDVAASAARALLAPDAALQWVQGWQDATTVLIWSDAGVIGVDVVSGAPRQP